MIRRSTVVVLLFLWPLTVSAQTPLNARVVEIVNALYTGVNPQDDNARRTRIITVCEQNAAEGLTRWGNKKRAGLSDDFRSPDSIAYLEDDGTISIWDIQLSSGAMDVFPGKPPNYPKDSPANSTFMGCAAVNHLGGPSGPAPPSPGQPPVIVLPSALDLSHLATKADLEQLRQEVASVKEDTKEIRAGMNRVLKFAGKYIVPIVGAVAAGWYMKPAEEQK